MATLTATKEVANFIDDNQFGSAESQMKCGPEIVSLFWHSTKPLEPNNYKSSDVHKMAHDLYEQFIGKDVPDDRNGTSDTSLYKMLDHFSFKYIKMSGSFNVSTSWPWVRTWLEHGYPVILNGIPESAVKDIALGGVRNPYNWNTQGLFHIILCTGPEKPGYIRVRDTANIDSNGIVRPGPRVYETTGLTFTSATMVVPSWLPFPVQTPPVAVYWKEQVQAHLDAIKKIIEAQQ